MKNIFLLVCFMLYSYGFAEEVAPPQDAQTSVVAENVTPEPPPLPTITELVKYPRTIGVVALIYNSIYQKFLNQSVNPYTSELKLDPYNVLIVERSDLENDIWHILPTGNTRQVLNVFGDLCPGVSPKFIPLADGTIFIRYIYENAFPETPQFILGGSCISENQAKMSKRFIISIIAVKNVLSEPGMLEWMDENRT